MSNFLDPALIGEVGAAVTGVTQWIKNDPRLKRMDGEHLAVGVGLVLGLGWFVVQGQIADALSLDAIRWENVFIAAVNGVLAGVSASGVFNLQKFLPIPNILPTRTEKDAAAITKTAMKTAVQQTTSTRKPVG